MPVCLTFVLSSFLLKYKILQAGKTFPELVGVVAKRIWLNDMYSKMFFSDLVVRNKVRNEDALSLLVKRLAEGVKQPVSHIRLANLISSAGVKISKSTIIDLSGI